MNTKAQMKELPSFWRTWAPYWSHQEDFLLDIEAINKLTTAIVGPVLVIGAGQGLLVERLQLKGFKVEGVDLDPDMIMYAKSRRGLDLIQANAKDMPFEDRTYKTSIIATGVVDFLSDEEEIRLIINEARRVTDDSGKVFVAFYRYHPEVERALRDIGLITDNGLNRFRRLYEMTMLSCCDRIGFIRAIKNEAKVGFFGALWLLLKTQTRLPKKEKRERKGMAKLWRQARKELDNPKSLIDCLPEHIPYRNEEQIRNLFKNLNVPIRNMFIYDSCTLVQL